MPSIIFVTASRELPSSFDRAGPAWLNGVEHGPSELRAFSATTPTALVEGASSNLFLNSETPVEQTITVTGSVTVSVGGTGAAQINGGTLGTALRDRPVTLTSPGSITITPVNNPAWVQVEPGARATSHIPTGPVPVARAADTWTAEVPLSGLINAAGVIQPGRTGFTPWLTADGLSIGQEGRGVRVTLDTDSILLPAALGWNAITLTEVAGVVRVIHNGTHAASWPGTLNLPAPTVMSGDTFVSWSSVPLGVPHSDPDGGTHQHTRWLSALRALGVEPDPLNVMDLDMSRGTFYHAIW